MAKLGRRSTTATAVLVILAVLAAMVAINISRRLLEGGHERATDAAFYVAPDPLPTEKPGTVIRYERIPSAPFGSIAWRVLYHSRDFAGNDIAVSGIVIAPATPAPIGGRTIVAWAHPTTGSEVNCAPSRETDPFFTMEGVHELLAAGYAVAATDYPGMGVAGPSSYLLGVPEANSVLDSARAARALPDIRAGSKLLLWGHSQGGQAALFAAQRAASYAPELKLEGVAVAAPAANLNQLMTDDIINISGVTIAANAVPAYEYWYSSTYSKEYIDSILTEQGLEATPKMASLCLLTQTKAIHAIAGPLIGQYVKSDPATTEPWQTMLTENSAGNQPITVPIYIAQGLADKLVIPSATQQFVKKLCSLGEPVSFHEFTGITHALIAYRAIPSLIPWLAEVNAGGKPASSC